LPFTINSAVTFDSANWEARALPLIDVPAQHQRHKTNQEYEWVRNIELHDIAPCAWASGL
jgi:hypothetical protein